MRVLLTSNASYAPPRGGSTRSNLAWLRHLAQRGHRCVVVSAAIGGADETILKDGIEIRSIHDFARRSAILKDHIRDVQPDWVLVSSEDLSHVLLREAEQAAPQKLIYLAHTPQFYPFGPESWNPDKKATETIRRARVVVAIGDHMAGYIRQHTSADAHVIHPPIYGAPSRGPIDTSNRRLVLMINPCLVKGIDIFTGVAGRFPDVPFAALIGWGTTTADKERLARIPNVRLLSSVPDIDDVLNQTRVLLMPSIWYEGFGLIVMEAMLRGVPVIASNSGGLMEAKEGTGYVIPVRPVERYLPEFDETHMPIPVRAEQDLAPWEAALRELLTDSRAYDQEVKRSLTRATTFVSGLNAADFEDLLVRNLQPALRILLAQNSHYYPSHGGGDKSNRLLMEALAARGHRVRVVARIEEFGPTPQAAFLRELQTRGIQPEISGGAARFTHNGAEVHTLTENPQIRAYLSEQITAFDPDIVITSTDDPAQLLFDVALHAARARVVHLVRATIAVPFGPDSSAPSATRASTLRRADAIVGVSEYVARYLRTHGDVPAVHVPISLMEPGEPPCLAAFDHPYVTFANPCAVKGIDIFLGIADAMPDLRFAAIPTWGTNAHDREALRARPNVDILSPVDNMDELFAKTRVLLVPSVWAEARSRIVVEAMLRGVPVIASDAGGIVEAKLGVPYLLPVNPIREYEHTVDEKMVPVAKVPPQDLAPWIQTLQRLTTDGGHWQEISHQSREAALQYLRTLSVEPFEAILRDTAAKPKKSASATSHLTDEKRRLLALRLRQRAARPSQTASRWFPVVEPLKSGELRLFCFPNAGGGTLIYRSWRDRLSGVASLVPACLPGREHRVHEPPIENMAELVAALQHELGPYLDMPFGFFGHSMGAAIAFELTRALRRAGAPLPRVLIASAARAPQFRANWTPPPEPTDDGFVEQLRRLEGVRREVLDDPEAMRILMPVLKADTRLFRRYSYTHEPPLDVPIRAYAGRTDPNVALEHVEAWREQTTADFSFRQYDGGHFYVQSHREMFLSALTEDIEQASARYT
jgi:surfactin synthase thioesterase subunit/glycosyltransferase involved in cell wall biosynthesis